MNDIINRKKAIIAAQIEANDAIEIEQSEFTKYLIRKLQMLNAGTKG